MSVFIFILLLILPYTILRMRSINLKWRLLALVITELLIATVVYNIVGYFKYDASGLSLMFFYIISSIMLTGNLSLIAGIWLRKRITGK